MIKSIVLMYNSIRKNIDFDSKQINKTVVDCSEIMTNKYNSFDIEIEFLIPIISFRNHDYTWIDLSSNRIATELSSKIIKLDNGSFVQANTTNGIWEVNKLNRHKLIWRFNPNFSKSITEYNGINNSKMITSANSFVDFIENPAFLFSNKNALEISRSKIPFSGIVCFTDHCDYDTLANLKLQRAFFLKHKIKTTKGFFLNHFSKRSDNASYENDSLELEKWKTDGHELCYHSLSQSIKSAAESTQDFENFKPPFTSIPVWIDHGFQPYNFSLYKNNDVSNIVFEQKLIEKNIKTLWNYIDSGTATNGVINQLDSSQFTLKKYWDGLQQFSMKTKLAMIFKNIIFHYDNDANRVRNYIDFVASARAIMEKKQVSKIFKLIENAIPLMLLVFKVVLFWNSEKNKPYKLAKYSPLVFPHKISNHTFSVFQTLEMVDFKKALSPKNVDLFCKQSGVFIAHTYFSVDMKHYSGKLFKNAGVLDEEVDSNFKNLSNKIQKNILWNPTLSELIEYFNIFEKIVFDVDQDGIIFIKTNTNIPSRVIN